MPQMVQPERVTEHQLMGLHSKHLVHLWTAHMSWHPSTGEDNANTTERSASLNCLYSLAAGGRT
jgi:hypothetical protein